MVTVLVADNDPGVRSLLVEVVRRLGCTVEAAIDGAAARERLERGAIDVLVCDLDMPRLSGNDLLAWIERQAVRPATVVVSGYVDGKLEAALAAMSCVRSVLRKPFDVVAFAHLVRGLAAAATPRCAAVVDDPPRSVGPSSPEPALAEPLGAATALPRVTPDGAAPAASGASD